jgi:uncharacterized protein involved in outer membrane biogenesis
MRARRLVIGIGVLLVAGGLGLFLLARSVFTGDNVRAAVAAQLSAALGQPVTIGGIGASVYPRVTMDLTDVAIGQPARIHLGAVHLGTGLRALLSRRIERAAVRVDRARITLPLPDLFPATGSDPGADPGTPPVEIVSIDEIVLRDVEVVSGNRTLRGDVELVPQGDGVQLRRVTLAADGTAIEATGTLTSLAPIGGRIEASAESLDFDRLTAFLTDFAGTPAETATPGQPPPMGAEAADRPAVTAGVGTLSVGLKVGRATTGGLTLSDLAATAVVVPGALTFDPLSFGVFGGRYDGTMHLLIEGAPQFRWRATVAGVDTAALMAFAGSPNTVSGALSGTIALDGEGIQMEQALRTARGTARVDITDGTIAGLALVRTLVTATSGRGGLAASGSQALQTRDARGAERFSRLGATLRLDRGVITTRDFSMTSTDVDLTASGKMHVASMTTDFAGRAQLSGALSKQAGTDLYRYAQEGGRVTLPVTVTGPIQHLSVRVDIGNAAMRAIRNRATDEAKKALERNLPGGLRGLIPKPR